MPSAPVICTLWESGAYVRPPWLASSGIHVDILPALTAIIRHLSLTEHPPPAMTSHHCSTVPTPTAPEAAPATATSDLLIAHPGKHISVIRTLLHLKWWTLPSGLKNYVMVKPVLPFFSHWCLVFHLLRKCLHFAPCKLDPLSPHVDISTKFSSPISRLGRVSYDGNSKSAFQPGFYWASNLH